MEDWREYESKKFEKEELLIKGKEEWRTVRKKGKCAVQGILVIRKKNGVKGRVNYRTTKLPNEEVIQTIKSKRAYPHKETLFFLTWTPQVEKILLSLLQKESAENWWTSNIGKKEIKRKLEEGCHSSDYSYFEIKFMPCVPILQVSFQSKLSHALPNSSTLYRVTSVHSPINTVLSECSVRFISHLVPLSSHCSFLSL